MLAEAFKRPAGRRKPLTVFFIMTWSVVPLHVSALNSMGFELSICESDEHTEAVNTAVREGTIDILFV